MIQISPTNSLAIDLETSGLRWKDRILTIGVAWTEEGAVRSDSINVGMRDLFTTPATIPEARAWLRGYLDKAPGWLIFHNGSFDLPYLLRSQLLSRDQARGRIFDTMVMARCTAPHDSVSLENLCEEYGIGGSEQWRKMKRMRGKLATADPGLVSGYARMDAENTLRLFGEVEGLANEQYGDDWIRDEGDFALLVAEMRLRGIPLDVEAISGMLADRGRKLHRIARWLAHLGIQGPSDRTTLPRILKRYGCSIPKTEKGNPSLDEKSMGWMYDMPGLAIEGKRLINAALKGRHWQKEMSTWFQGMLDEADDRGRVHPNYTASGTISYRLTCSNPNAQAVPPHLRIWLPGLVEADYSQAELRVAAMYAAENGFAETFAKGEDIHGATAQAMFDNYDEDKHRFLGKRCNFLVVYGGGKNALAESTGISEKAAANLLKKHRAAFPSFVRVSKQAEAAWIERGYVTLAHGKRRYANRLDIQHAYKAFNQLVQGSVAEIIGRAMLEIDRHVPEVRIVNQIHDSLVMEGDVENGAVRERVREIMADSVPKSLRHRTTPSIFMEVDIKGE